MNPLSILIVDDDETMREALALVLKGTPHLPTFAADATTALRYLGQAHFDVVLTDILLSEQDGTVVLQAAARLQPHARLVAMSGGGERLSPSYCLSLGVAFGAVAPLMKPFTLADLLAAVEGRPIQPVRDACWLG